MKKFIISSLGLMVMALAIAGSPLSAQQNSGSNNSNSQACFILGNKLNIGSNDRNSNGEVTKLQQFLKLKGFFNGDPTGNFGNFTWKAVKAFQKAHGVDSTGNVGPYTRMKIREIGCGLSTDKSVMVTVSADKHAYKANEKITLTITATNASTTEKVLNWTTGCQVSYAIGTYDSTKNTTCVQSLSSTTIPARGTKTWTVVHDLAQNPITPGSYSVVGNVIGYGYAGTNLTITPLPPIVPTISSLSTTTAPVGTSVTVTGTGFSATNNTVRFGQGVIKNLPATSSTSLTFVVPASINPACLYSTPVCRVVSRMTIPGKYNVAVTNDQGKSSSQSVVFTVIAPQAQVTYTLTVAQTFAASNTILMSLTAHNTGNVPATLTFPNGCKTRYTLTNSAGAVVYDSNAGLMCTQIYGTEPLGPGESKSWPISYDITSHKVPAGTYTVTAYLANNGSATTTITIPQ